MRIKRKNKLLYETWTQLPSSREKKTYINVDFSMSADVVKIQTSYIQFIKASNYMFRFPL